MLEVPAHALGRVLVLVYGCARQQSGLRQSVVPEIPGHLAVLPVLALLRHLAQGSRCPYLFWHAFAVHRTARRCPTGAGYKTKCEGLSLRR